MNVEIKGVDGKDLTVYAHGADLLAALLKKSRRTDVIVTSFEQSAIDRFHALAPKVPLAPGIGGTANFFLSNGSPGPGVVAFQVPITFKFGDQLLVITTPNFVQRAHDAGYAVHVWLSNDTEDVATYKRLLNMCVDGIMAANPRAFEAVLRKAGYGQPGQPGSDPCTTRATPRRASPVVGATATVQLQRRGLSLEHRRGSVLLAKPGRAGTVLGKGTYDLATGAAGTTSKVRLTAAGRAALRGRRTLVADAVVSDLGRGTVTRTTLTAG
jgi:glycerophosphoryl diester phosphodiesterase